MTLKLRILRSLTRLFIILVSLRRSLFSEKMLISNKCISGLMSNLIKKSWTVSNLDIVLLLENLVSRLSGVHNSPLKYDYSSKTKSCNALDFIFIHISWNQVKSSNRVFQNVGKISSYTVQTQEFRKSWYFQKCQNWSSWKLFWNPNLW